MNEIIEIKGGAGAFEAAVVAVLLDHLAGEERAAQIVQSGPTLPRWVRALDEEDDPLFDRRWSQRA
jgi:hypothetical protein